MVSSVLVTGAAGRVAAVLRPHLRTRYRVRLLDRIAIADPQENEEAVVGDMNDESFLLEQLQGVDGVLHLACVHGYGATFEETLDSNYRATLAVLAGSVASGVERFVYTSSHHVLGLHPRDGFEGDDAALAPDGFYGLSKAFGEAACSLYAHRFELPILVIRVGNADPLVGDDRRGRIWTSGRDLAALIDIGFTHPGITCDVVYGVSRCAAPLFHNTRAAELGYEALDHAEDHLDPDYVPYEGMEPGGRDHVGGPYVAAPLPGPGRPS